MPLSEDEQRILRQIEEQLQRDPSFGRDIKPRHVGSRRAVIVSSVPFGKRTGSANSPRYWPQPIFRPTPPSRRPCWMSGT